MAQRHGTGLGYRILILGLTAGCALLAVLPLALALFDEIPASALVILELLFWPLLLSLLWHAWTSCDTIELTDTQLIRRRWGLPKRIPLAAIERAEMGKHLWLHTRQGARVRLGAPRRDALTALLRILEVKVPALRAQREAALARSLPVTLSVSRSAVLQNLFMTVALGAMLALPYGLMAKELLEGNFDDLWSMGLFCLLTSPLLLLVPWLLVRTVWSYTFGHDWIVVQKTFHRERYEVAKLSGLALRSEQRTTKGATRTAAILDVSFSDGRVLHVEPTESAAPIGDAPNTDRAQLNDLHTVLRRAYRERLL